MKSKKLDAASRSTVQLKREKRVKLGAMPFKYRKKVK